VYLRFPQQYAAVLNLFLIAIIAYFLALGVSNGIKLHLAGTADSEFAHSGGHQSLRRPQIGPRPRAYYDIIVTRDVFSRAAPAATPTPVQNESLDVTLIGTSHRTAGKPYVIVETTDGEQSLYRLGETIPNVGPVLSIGRNQAVVLHNGNRVELKIPNAGEGETQQPTPFNYRRRRWIRRRGLQFPRPGGPYAPFGAQQNSKAGVHQLSPNRYLIGRATVNSSLTNMAPLFTEIRAVPNLQNGSSNGFRLSQIQPGSIFQQIGLQDGDVVTGAQGQPINDPLRAMSMLNTLRNSSSISLNLIRNGSPLELHYTIH